MPFQTQTSNTHTQIYVFASGVFVMQMHCCNYKIELKPPGGQPIDSSISLSLSLSLSRFVPQTKLACRGSYFTSIVIPL